MITDSLLRLSAAQTLAMTNTSAVSTNTIDLGTARDMGEGEPIYAVFTITTACVGGTSTQFDVIATSDAGLTTNVITVGSSGAVLTANLTLGAQIAVRLNPQIASKVQQYLGAKYTVVGTQTAGAVTCDIVHDIQDGKKFYASGFSVN